MKDCSRTGNQAGRWSARVTPNRAPTPNRARSLFGKFNAIGNARRMGCGRFVAANDLEHAVHRANARFRPQDCVWATTGLRVHAHPTTQPGDAAGAGRYFLASAGDWDGRARARVVGEQESTFHGTIGPGRSGVGALHVPRTNVALESSAYGYGDPHNERGRVTGRARTSGARTSGSAFMDLGLRSEICIRAVSPGGTENRGEAKRARFNFELAYAKPSQSTDSVGDARTAAATYGACSHQPTSART